MKMVILIVVILLGIMLGLIGKVLYGIALAEEVCEEFKEDLR